MMNQDLPELEPAEESPQPTQQVDYQVAIFRRMLCGAPAPAFNPNASTEYYRFLFAGVLIVVGCLMPFDHDWSHVGYKTFAGAVWLVIGLGLIWSMWGAINSGFLRMKWVLLCFVPFIWGLFHMIFAKFPEGGVANWGELFQVLADTGDADRFHKFGNALQYIGPGKIFVFLGSFFAIVSFIVGIFTGVKRIKEQKAERRAAVASRRG